MLAFANLTSAQVNADFTADVVAGCSPLIVKFQAAASSDPTVTYHWDLGNGSTPTLPSPSTIYINPGTYTISLTATKAGTSATITKVAYITVYPDPVVDFDATVKAGCFPLRTQFSDKSTAGSGTIKSWQWDFGDGQTSTAKDPFHVYRIDGNFNVTLFVESNNGCIAKLSKPSMISIPNGVIPEFTNDAPVNCKPPAVVNFQNQSTGPGTVTYKWLFGDGKTSNAKDPSNTYMNPGVYPVSLIATSSNGCYDTLTRIREITVENIKNDFSYGNSCVNQPVFFQNLSTPAPINVTWSFGDGTTSPFPNPGKIFSTPGTYNVKVVNNFGVCIDSITRPVVVGDYPVAQFTSKDTVACKFPFTASFQDISANATSWLWDFGDGKTSTEKNPIHTYTDSGRYKVRLVIGNVTGCLDTVEMKDFVKILEPRIFFKALPDSGCVPYTIHPIANVIAVDGVASYQWNFGDGGNGSGPTPSHQYTAFGKYDISLTVTTNQGCVKTETIKNAVKVGTPLVPDFSYTPSGILCASTPVSFTTISPPPDTAFTYVWEFGDGAYGYKRDMSHVYIDTGRMTVKLTLFNNGCGQEVIKKDIFQIIPPVSKYGYQVDCSDPRKVQFTDSSISATTYLWEFEGGGTSTDKNPQHTFPARGRWEVKLTTTFLGCTYTKIDTVRADIERPDFIISSPTACKQEEVELTAIIKDTTNVNRYQWRFSNGDTIGSLGRFAYYTFPQSGDNTVRLAIMDVNGCVDSLVKPIRINGPKANFGIPDATSCKGFGVQFIDSTQTDGVNPITTRVWTWGDGKKDTVTNAPFNHAYGTAGIYSVKLLAIDAAGCRDSLLRFNYVIVSNVRSDFFSNDTLSCSNGGVQFNQRTLGTIKSFQWNFGDGNTSDQMDPVHKYTLPGIYDISLIIEDVFGCRDSSARAQYITVGFPQSAFDISDSIAACPPLKVNFTFKGQYFTDYKWDFGDSTSSPFQDPDHFYSIPGTYEAKLILTSPGGCTDTARKTIQVFGPFGTLTAFPKDGCEPLTTELRVQSNGIIKYFSWDDNNGTVIKNSKDSVQTFIYPSGIYKPLVALEDTTGCIVTIEEKDPIIVYSAKADFTSDKKIVCDQGNISFSDKSAATDIIVSYLWNFGDGATSTDKNPTHYYSINGTYTISLSVITKAGCTDTIVVPDYIKVVSRPDIDIQGASFSACQPATLTFNGIEIVKDTSVLQWNWNMANGNQYAIKDPPAQLYTNDGTFTISLIATNSSGCPDTALKSLVIHPLPPTKTNEDTTICLGDAIQLNTTGASTYTWIQPATHISCTNCPDPIINPEFDTRFIVQGVSNFGCIKNDTMEVKVKRPFSMSVSPSDSICESQNTRLRASGAELYIWSPASSLSSSTISNPVATPLTTTTYFVTGYDNKNCFTVTDSITISVFPYPTVDLGTDDTILVGYERKLTPLITGGPVSVQWKPYETLSCRDCIDPVAKPVKTTNYEIYVMNQGGCEAKDDITIHVICNNTNLFIANTFSPNGDGINEWFYPQGRGINSIQSLRVFNRWGQMVFERQNFSPNAPTLGWNGMFNGQNATPDVYVYIVDVICDNGYPFSFKGNVALIR